MGANFLNDNFKKNRGHFFLKLGANVLVEFKMFH